MSAQNGKEATFGLLYNGLDFLVSALEHLQGDPSVRSMKYGVLHLSAGVALVLKEPLRRHDPKLLFEKPDEFDQAAYEAGDFKSVRVEECIKRLKKIGVPVPSAAKAAINALKPDRNRLEHFAAKLSVADLSAVTASVLSFAVDFVRYRVGLITDDEGELVERIREGLPEFQALVTTRMNEIAPALKTAVAVRTCSRCAQEALVLGGGDVECAFCTRTFTAAEAAAEYASDLGYSYYDALQRGDYWPVQECPACGVIEVLVREDTGYVCFYCGDEKHYESCMNCGALYDDPEQGTVCAECFEAAVAADD